MRLSSSRLQVVPCIPQCVPVQTSPIWHDELRRLDILPCNQTFQGLFYGCRRCGFLVVAMILYGRSKVNVWQLWDDQHWLKQICPNIAWVRLSGRSTDSLQRSVVMSLHFWDSSRGLNNMCPSLVHDNALNCSYSNTDEHTSRPPRLQVVSSTLSVVSALTKARQLNSPGLSLQTHVGCVNVVRLNLVEG